jgi:hypothetical protein
VAAAHGHQGGAGGPRWRRRPVGVGAGSPRRRRRPGSVGVGGRAALGGKAAEIHDGVWVAVRAGRGRVRRAVHDDGQGSNWGSKRRAAVR